MSGRLDPEGRFWRAAECKRLLARDLRATCRWCGRALTPRGTGVVCSSCDYLERMPEVH